MAFPDFSLFSPVHLAYLAAWSVLWVIVPLIGLRCLNLRGRNITAIGLAWITVVQEAVDYLNRISIRELTILADLPLQFCHLASIFSVLLVFFRMPLLFEVTYFWGLIGASQAMLTPDPSAFDSHLTYFLFFMQHGMLILIVLWLVFVAGLRCRSLAVFRTFIFTNFIMIPVGLLDWVIGANYMYLRASPVTDNPFVWGGWPWYIVQIEGVGLLMMAFLQFPMMLARGRKPVQRRAERSFSKR